MLTEILREISLTAGRARSLSVARSSAHYGRPDPRLHAVPDHGRGIHRGWSDCSLHHAVRPHGVAPSSGGGARPLLDPPALPRSALRERSRARDIDVPLFKLESTGVGPCALDGHGMPQAVSAADRQPVCTSTRRTVRKSLSGNCQSLLEPLRRIAVAYLRGLMLRIATPRCRGVHTTFLMLPAGQALITLVVY